MDLIILMKPNISNHILKGNYTILLEKKIHLILKWWPIITKSGDKLP